MKLTRNETANSDASLVRVPWFGVRRLAKLLQERVRELEARNQSVEASLRDIGGLTILEREQKRAELDALIATREAEILGAREKAESEASAIREQIESLRQQLVQTEELVLLQEAGVYEYRHPLTDAVAYQQRLTELGAETKAMTKKHGGAVLATTDWTVNGSAAEGKAMVRDFSKLMLRAFNAEADNLVRGLKPYKLHAAKDRLEKVAATIERLGKTMRIRISTPYLQLRERELELTADFLAKHAEEKEAERLERERLREERKVQQQMERERAKLEKERTHYANALQVLLDKGDAEAAERMRRQIEDVNRAIADVDYRAANIRAGYVYVISNIGSFGEEMVKIGMTRRLDPMDRIRELSDASVPFNFDIHALFFSKDAVGIEAAMHERLSASRVNTVNLRREFFRVTALDVKRHLAELAGDLLQFEETPEALEYRHSLARGNAVAEA